LKMIITTMWYNLVSLESVVKIRTVTTVLDSRKMFMMMHSSKKKIPNMLSRVESTMTIYVKSMTFSFELDSIKFTEL
jgi:hypothetical protein